MIIIIQIFVLKFNEYNSVIYQVREIISIVPILSEPGLNFS